MTLTEHARTTLARQMAKLDAQIAAGLNKTDEDAVHDFRVAVRRLTQSLRLFAPGRASRPWRRALKPALEAAATVRDLDVDAALLVAQGLDEGHALIGKMQADRVRAAYAFMGQLYLLRALDVPAAWTAKLDGLVLSAEPAAAAARTVLPELFDQFLRAGARAAESGARPERLHTFRLQAKRFRYSLEVFRPFYGPVCDQRIAEVRQIQDLLGKRQDCAVTVARLAVLAELDAAVAAVLVKLETRATRLEGEFRTHWAAHFGVEPEVLRRRRYLTRRAPMP